MINKAPGKCLIWIIECVCVYLSNLCVSTGVPVWVIDDDSVGSSQIDSQASDFSGKQEDKNGFVL